MENLFFELLLISVGAKDSLSRTYSEKEWKRAFAIANEQAIAGVLMSALEQIQEKENSDLPSKDFLLQWIGIEQITVQNSQRLKEAGEQVVSYFRKNGFACELLKGAAVARYYPVPLRRTSGDVDIWVDGGRKRIYEFARHYDKDGKLYGVNYHHIHFHLIEDVHTEVHIWPSFLSSPIRNKRLHRFCQKYQPTMEQCMPSLAFDRVFILLHCYRHICGDGVGLRQVMDYYYVLKQGFNEEERKETVKWINTLGMNHFARGLMWVLQFVLGMDEKFLLMQADEKEGRFILNEILMTGNMGHSDTRNWGSKQTAMSRFFLNFRRDLYLAKHYPHEALWQPVFSLWLYLWRLSNGLLKDRED